MRRMLWMMQHAYVNEARHKFGYGATNVLLGWMDLFLEPLEAISERRGVWSGLGNGVLDALRNTGGWI